MAEALMLPVGIDNFEKIRKSGFCYIDKTKLIEQILESCGKINLFTRPRRFGKTLNLSMLRSFFEIGADKELFNGLYITKNQKLCEEYMGRYPVIFISLKGVEGLTYEEAEDRMAELIGCEAERFDFLLDSDKLSANDKMRFKALITLDNGQYSMNKNMLIASLKLLSQLLYKHYSQKAIILIDEYDVPLDKAFQNGYYKEMVSLIRGMFGSALKTNEALQFAVLTGCLRISKESIFTGLNNFKILSITDSRFDEQFGFTEAEVRELLGYYKLDSHLKAAKEWYDGYHFGDADVYCPWDVINYVDSLNASSDASPQAYWINTSSNELVKRLIYRADRKTKNEIERLVAGEVIKKELHQELTYDEIDNSIENIWSVLFTTGYLTQDKKAEDGVFSLKIPNEEVRTVYKRQIREWMNTSIKNDSNKLTLFWNDVQEGNTEAIEEYMNHMLDSTISIFDTKSRKGEKENSYHMLLTGILSANADWEVKSNVESGDGFADIIVEPDNYRAGIVIELKHSMTYDGMDKACKDAIEQIIDKRYDTYLKNEQRTDILVYGMAFCKKRCKVAVRRI